MGSVCSNNIFPEGIVAQKRYFSLDLLQKSWEYLSRPKVFLTRSIHGFASLWRHEQDIWMKSKVPLINICWPNKLGALSFVCGVDRQILLLQLILLFCCGSGLVGIWGLHRVDSHSATEIFYFVSAQLYIWRGRSLSRAALCSGSGTPTSLPFTRPLCQSLSFPQYFQQKVCRLFPFSSATPGVWQV